VLRSGLKIDTGDYGSRSRTAILTQFKASNQARTRGSLPLTNDSSENVVLRRRLRAAGISVARTLARTNRLEGMYLSGSLYANLATDRSDVDLYVLAEESALRSLNVPGRISATGRDIVHIRRHGITVDIEPRTVERLRHLVDKYSVFTFDLGHPDQVSLSPVELNDVVRLYLGESIGASDIVRDLQQRLNRTVLRQLVITHYASRCNHLLRDILGQWQRGDSVSLAHVARNVLNLALQAFAAGVDEIYVGDKWVWVKLARSMRGLSYRNLVGVAFGVRSRVHYGALSTNLIRVAEDWILTSQALLCAALLDGWEAASASVHWQPLLFNSARSKTSMRRSPLWFPLRTRNEVYIASHDEALTAGVDGLRLWSLCDGRSADAVVDAMLSILGNGRRQTRISVERYLNRLVKLRAVMAS